MYGESDNICNLPEVLIVELHKSATTGKYYLHFIDHSDTTCNNKGYWTDIPTSEEAAKQLMRMCYTDWDGETKPYKFDDGTNWENNCNCSNCKNAECNNSFQHALDNKYLREYDGGVLT